MIPEIAKRFLIINDQLDDDAYKFKPVLRP